VKPASLAAEREFEQVLETIRGIAAVLCLAATAVSEETPIFEYLGRELSQAHERGVHAYGRAFFGADREAAE
jgi:hypothetical protein